jgi:D-inositol-3-phosphate glycosyltransferase
MNDPAPKTGDPMSPLSAPIAMVCMHSSPMGALGTRDTGGMSVYVGELARELGRRGHGVDIFTLQRRTGQPVVSRLADNVALVSVPVAGSRGLSKNALADCVDDFMAGIEAHRRRHKIAYALVHSHYWLSGLVGQIARGCWQRPHVITFHTLGALKAGTGVGAAEPSRRLAVEEQLATGCDGYLVACEREKKNLMRYYGSDPARIAMVPGGVDPERFRPMSAVAARQMLGLDAGLFIVLTVGRLTPLKGQERVIEALALLGGETPAELMLVGGDGRADPEQRRLETIAAQLQVRVRFAGSVPQEQLPVYYAAANAVVHASHYESFGLVGLEAMACGRPVVATPVGVMATLARDKCPGAVIADGRPAALAAGIAALRSGKISWPAEAIRDAVCGFTWSAAAAAALEAYRAAATAQTRPGGR